MGTEHFAWAMILVLSVPALVAFIFGFFAFRSKIKGVYFSIITQAMTFAAALLFFRNETGFGGNNGFTGFKTLLGFDITSAPMRASLCFVTALVLMLCFIGLRQLMNRPYGRVLGAIRDSENRLQYLGYRTLWYKLSAWVLSAVIAGIAGALYVPQVGIINPSEMNPVNSIEMAVWVAAGGAWYLDWTDSWCRFNQCGEDLFYSCSTRSLVTDLRGFIYCGDDFLTERRDWFI